MNLSTTFAGSYELFDFIIKKYDIYDSDIRNIVRNYNYRINKRNHSDYWNWFYYGVPLKLWNLLYKDLMILKLAGIIQFESLEKLREEYERLN
jgi:hypothetical protein